MKKNMVNFTVVAALAMSAFAANAEDMYRGAWYAVPGVSYMNTDSDLDANNGGGAFIKLGKELSEKWDIQGGLGYNRASEDTGISGVHGKYKQTTLGLDALYMLAVITSVRSCWLVWVLHVTTWITNWPVLILMVKKLHG